MAVQTIDRAVAVLSWLGNSGEQGMRLIDRQRAWAEAVDGSPDIGMGDHGLVSCDERTLSFPKIISAHSDGAAPTERAQR
jgi:hypothetical protein